MEDGLMWEASMGSVFIFLFGVFLGAYFMLPPIGAQVAQTEVVAHGCGVMDLETGAFRWSTVDYLGGIY